jgi:hypothetical protein
MTRVRSISPGTTTMEFFDEFWPHLNLAGDPELLTFHEPYQLNQNSCTILRRATEYRPSFTTMTPARVVAAHKGGGGS